MPLAGVRVIEKGKVMNISFSVFLWEVILRKKWEWKPQVSGEMSLRPRAHVS